MEVKETDLMRKYIEITLKPDELAGITTPVLMGHVIKKLHKMFVGIKDENDQIPIGLSFPQYNEDFLGSIVRLHSEEENFQKIDPKRALIVLSDYVHVTNPRPLLIDAKRYVSYRRVRHEHGKEKLIRRYMKRHDKSYEEASSHYEGYKRNRFPKDPFVCLTSNSTGRRNYPMYLRQQITDKPGNSKFNTFGIAPDSGVELF